MKAQNQSPLDISNPIKANRVKTESMEVVQRVAWRLRVVPIVFQNGFVTSRREMSSGPGWLVGKLAKIVKAGEPVLHSRAEEVEAIDMKSERVQKIIDDMIRVMRKAPGVGLAAPQIGIPLRIIVLEDKTEYMTYYSKEELKAQDRTPFDLLVILNPKLKNKTTRTALFFEGCLSVSGYSAVVERYLDVEVAGYDRYGEPVKINATGWQARILQHECDHLDGTLYVDKMVRRTFRATENSYKPLAHGCPKLGPR